MRLKLVLAAFGCVVPISGCFDDQDVIADRDRHVRSVVQEALDMPDEGRGEMAKYCDHDLADPLSARSPEDSAALEAEWDLYLDICETWLDAVGG